MLEIEIFLNVSRLWLSLWPMLRYHRSTCDDDSLSWMNRHDREYSIQQPGNPCLLPASSIQITSINRAFLLSNISLKMENWFGRQRAVWLVVCLGHTFYCSAGLFRASFWHQVIGSRGVIFMWNVQQMIVWWLGA